LLTNKTLGTHRVIESFDNEQLAISKFEVITQNPSSILLPTEANGEYMLEIKYMINQCEIHKGVGWCDCGYHVSKTDRCLFVI
jgi:hypothetical protein